MGQCKNKNFNVHAMEVDKKGITIIKFNIAL